MAPHAFTSPSGLTVRVGRDAAGNAALSRSADPSALWLHADCAGAHVVLDAGGTKADVQFAADLAAFFSKARSTGRTRVSVARCGDVRTYPDGKAELASTRTVWGVPRPVPSSAC